jgi:hypothetical protein
MRPLVKLFGFGEGPVAIGKIGGVNIWVPIAAMAIFYLPIIIPRR